MTNFNPSEPNAASPSSYDPTVTRVKTPYRERLQSPSNINTVRSISILVVQSVIMMGLAALAGNFLPLEWRPVGVIMVASVALALAHTLVRARRAAYVVMTVIILAGLWTLFIIDPPRDADETQFLLIMWLLYSGVAMIIAGVVELCHKGEPHWDPWRSYFVVTLMAAFGGLAATIGEQRAYWSPLVSFMAVVVTQVGIFFVLRQICAVLEGFGIYGTPATPTPPPGIGLPLGGGPWAQR